MRKFKPYKLPPKKNILIQHGTSNEELELYNSIRLTAPDLTIYRGDRLILHGRELDIWIPSLKLAFEYDGLFYHNASKKDEPYYHLYKTVECEKQGIRLVHVFSDDWTVRKPQTLDFIYKILGKYQVLNTYYVAEISKSEGKQFLDNTHLRGNDNNAKKYLALIYNGDIVSVISLRERDKDLEITRYAERRGIHSPNGLKDFCDFIFNKYKCDIYATVDRSIDDGSDFKKAGFQEIAATEPGCFYTKDFKTRLSEAVEDSVKVYDCGKKLLKKSQKDDI